MKASDLICEPDVRTRLRGRQDGTKKPAKVRQVRERFRFWIRHRARLIDLVHAFAPSQDDAVKTLYPFDEQRYYRRGNDR